MPRHRDRPECVADDGVVGVVGLLGGDGAGVADGGGDAVAGVGVVGEAEFVVGELEYSGVYFCDEAGNGGW
jgi:hypothetical protein